MERLAPEPHTRLRYFCSPQHTDSALYPIISQMERAAGFTHEDTAAIEAGQTGCFAGAEFDAREDAALFAEMLSLPNDGRYPTLELAAAAAAAKNAGSANYATRSTVALQSGLDDFRGRALARPDQP